MNISDYCMNCFKPRGATEVCPHCGFINNGNPKESFQLKPGKILNNRYLIGYAVSNGGFGIVYKAFDLKLNFIVAVKEYFPAGLVNRIPGKDEIVLFSPDKKAEFNTGKQKFLTEAKTIAKFDSHPGIVNIYNFFEENGTAYIAMEYLDGITLSKYLIDHGGKLSVDETLKIIIPIINALGDVHRENIIHRDISPANIMITVDGKIKLIDFGAAKFSDEENEATRSIVLKPGYAPPEQYRKKSKQAAFTDIYAVGATIYEMITGVKPSESVDRMVEDDLIPPQKLEKSIPENISFAIEKAMQLSPDLRFRRMNEFKEALENKRKVIDPAEELKKRKTRKAVLIPLVAVLVICSIIGTISTIREANKEKSPYEFLNGAATIDVWLPIENDEQQKMYEAVCKKFLEGIPETAAAYKVNMKFLTDAEYSEQLKKSIGTEEMPEVFMCSETSAVSKEQLLDLSEVSYAYLNNKCAFIGENIKYCIPTAFETDMLFVNKKIATDFSETNEYDKLDNLPGINDSTKVLFGKTINPNFKSKYSETALTDFASGNKKYYVGTSRDEQVIKTAGNIYTVYLCGVKIPGTSITCEGKNTWCVLKTANNQNALSKAFVAHLLTEEIQDYMYVNNSGYLPINLSVFDSMTSEYRKQYRFIIDNKESIEWVGIEKSAEDN